MEPITTTMIATLILSKAAEEGGKKLGEAVSGKIGQLFNLIREKFKAVGVEGKLAKVQEDPSDKNRDRFEQELEYQMEDDKDFADNLKALVKELQSNDQFKQIFLEDVEATGNIKAGKVTQKGKGTQIAGKNLKAGGDVNFGDVEQEQKVD